MLLHVKTTSSKQMDWTVCIWVLPTPVNMMCTIQSRTAFRIFCLWLKHAYVLLLLKSFHILYFLDFLHKEGVPRPKPLSWGEHILLKGAFKWYWWSLFSPSLEATITWMGPHISSVEMLQKYQEVNYHWKIHALLITCKIYLKKNSVTQSRMLKAFNESISSKSYG